MNEDYNIIQYVIPENSEVTFDILPHVRDVILVLLNGIADLCLENKEISLPLCQEFPIPVWKCLKPCLKAKSTCELRVYGSHYFNFSAYEEHFKNTVYSVFASGNSFSFVLGKDNQLQIFPVPYTEEDATVTIKTSRGVPEVSGYKLSSNVTYSLSPYSPVLIKPSDEQPYSVYVNGLNRRVKLSILDENNHARMKAVREHFFAQCLFMQKLKHFYPTILVLGERNVGKSSFCQMLVNDALEKNMTPMYVDLNVQRNLSIPGSLSLTEIKNRIDNTLDFECNTQKMLHFGALTLHTSKMRLYYFLIRKMSGLLSLHFRQNNKNTLTIIDTAGYEGDNISAISHILQSFPIDLVIVIGDQCYYENLKNSILNTIPSEFIPKPLDIEPPSDNLDLQCYCQYSFKKYFYGSIHKPTVPSICTVRFDCLTIYKLSIFGNSRNVGDEKISEFKMERIACTPNLRDRLLAVSRAMSIDDINSLPEVKYYVCLMEVDADRKIATVLVPATENFRGGILLMGKSLKFKTS